MNFCSKFCSLSFLTSSTLYICCLILGWEGKDIDDHVELDWHSPNYHCLGMFVCFILWIWRYDAENCVPSLLLYSWKWILQRALLKVGTQISFILVVDMGWELSYQIQMTHGTLYLIQSLKHKILFKHLCWLIIWVTGPTGGGWAEDRLGGRYWSW